MSEGSLTGRADEAGNPIALTKGANSTLKLSGTHLTMAKTRSEESIRERPLNGIWCENSVHSDEATWIP